MAGLRGGARSAPLDALRTYLCTTGRTNKPAICTLTCGNVSPSAYPYVEPHTTRLAPFDGIFHSVSQPCLPSITSRPLDTLITTDLTLDDPLRPRTTPAPSQAEKANAMASTATVHEHGHDQDGLNNPLSPLSSGRQSPSRKETILSLVEMLLQESGHAARGPAYISFVRPSTHFVKVKAQTPSFEDDRDVRESTQQRSIRSS